MEPIKQLLQRAAKWLFGAQSRAHVAGRIFLIFALSALLPTLIGIGMAYMTVQAELSSQAQSRLGDLAKNYGLAVYSRLTAADEALQRYAESSLRESDASSRAFSSLSILDSSDPSLPKTDSQDDGRLAAAAEKAMTVTGRDSSLVVGHDDSKAFPVLVRRLPGTAHRYAIGWIRHDYLWQDSDVVDSRTHVCVGDRTGSFRVCAAAESAAESDSAVAREAALTARWPLFLRARFGADEWIVEASQPQAVALSALQKFRSTLLPAGCIALVLAIALGMLELRRSIRPLERLLAAISRLARGEFADRVEPESAGDFAEIASSINLTAERLGQQFLALSALSEIDRKILTSDSLDAVIRSVLPRARDFAGCRGSALLLTTRPDHEGDALFLAGGDSAVVRMDCKLDRHAVRRLVEAGRTSMSQSSMPALTVLRDAGFQYADALPVHEETDLVGAVLLLDPVESAIGPARERAAALADRLSVAVSHAHRKQDLVRNAYFDPLTGLANRELLSDRISQALTGLGANRSLAVLLVGLDRFKNINDTLGHRAGDEVLILTAERLRNAVDGANTIARLTGDEFVILMTGVDDPTRAGATAARIETALAQPFMAGGVGYFLSASIGIALGPNDGRTPDLLIRNADTAMRAAKSRKPGSIVYFEETMNDQARRRVQLEHGLRMALINHELELHYQPKIEIKSGRVVGCEALLRWRHPTEGLINPAHFIPIAEETGLIVSIGYWVIEEACRDFQQWRASGLPLEHTAVNLSPRQLSDSHFVEEVVRRLETFSMPPGSLELEVTESSIAERPHELPRVLQSVRQHGVRIAIDDFGTGYSSLAMLRLLPFDVLKIDRSFIGGIDAGGTGEALASAIIAMGIVLGKELVAEGVETVSQARLLAQRGCALAQGYYYSKALPAADFVRFCESRVETPSPESDAAAEEPHALRA